MAARGHLLPDVFVGLATIRRRPSYVLLFFSYLGPGHSWELFVNAGLYMTKVLLNPYIVW